MSRTHKDTRRNKMRPTMLQVVKNRDATFEVCFNGKLTSRVPERWLNDLLCGRFGFCGDEYEAIVRRLHEFGKATVAL